MLGKKIYEEECDPEFDDSYNEGFQEGHELGFKQGFDQCLQVVCRELGKNLNCRQIAQILNLPFDQVVNAVFPIPNRDATY